VGSLPHYFLEFRLLFDGFGGVPVEGQGWLVLSGGRVHLSGQILFVVLSVGSVAYFPAVDGDSGKSVLDSSKPFLFQRLQGLVVEHNKFLPFLGFHCFFLLLAYLPQVVGLVGSEVLEV
jgi:hypothetical protein